MCTLTSSRHSNRQLHDSPEGPGVRTPGKNMGEGDPGLTDHNNLPRLDYMTNIAYGQNLLI